MNYFFRTKNKEQGTKTFLFTIILSLRAWLLSEVEV